MVRLRESSGSDVSPSLPEEVTAATPRPPEPCPVRDTRGSRRGIGAIHPCRRDAPGSGPRDAR